MEASAKDRRMAKAWPATVELEDSGWLLRSNGGSTRRANSAWALAPTGEDMVERVEDFYSARGPARMFVSTASSDPDLGEQLAARGYVETATTNVCAAPTATVLACSAPNHVVTISQAFDERWFDVFCAASSIRTKDASGYRSLLQPHATALFARVGEAAVGQVVIIDDVAVIQCMVTGSEHRGNGAATTILHTLAAEAQHLGAVEMELGVMADNAVARRVYDRAGFTMSHQYSYWTLS